MTEKRKSFLIYIDTLPLFDDLEDTDELNLYRAINLYHRSLPFNLTPVTKPLFKLFEAQFIRDKERYDKRCEQNRANILKRYEPLQSNTNEDEREQSHTKHTDRDSKKIEKVIIYPLFPLGFPPTVRKRFPTNSERKRKI